MLSSEVGRSRSRMPVKDFQQNVPAGTVPVVEPTVPRLAPLGPQPLSAEDEVEYPSEDGLPLSTGPEHFEWLTDGYRRLKHRYRGRTDLFLGCDMLIYYERGNNKARVAPDMFVSFDVPLAGVPLEDQKSYFVWLEGKPPDVVWEFGPPVSVKGDAAEKKETYRRMGVREYWLVDPVGDYHEPRLQGFELVDGVYKELPWERGPDGMVAAWSPLLELEQRIVDGRQRFCDRSAPRYLELPEEEERRGRLEERRGRLEAESRAQSAEQALESEKRARKALEARLAEFEAQSRGPRNPS